MILVLICIHATTCFALLNAAIECFRKRKKKKTRKGRKKKEQQIKQFCAKNLQKKLHVELQVNRLIHSLPLP